MATLKELKQKIASVKNTQKTTRAMKLVSTAKLKRAEEALIMSRVYARKIDEVMKDISAKLAMVKENINIRAFSVIDNPKVVDLIVITADKGLCGGFNIQTIKKSKELLEEFKNRQVQVRLKVIGKKAIEYFKFAGIEMEQKIEGLSAIPDYEKSAEVIEESYQDFVEEKIDNIIIVYNGYVNKLTQEVKVIDLIPIPVDKPEENTFVEVEPDDDYSTILESLVKKYIEYSLYYALLDSLAAEHSARMQAMEAATNNAQEMVRQLTLQFNKARQEAVTRELIEIVTAIEAMKKQ
ncbi:MAG: F0F1 ATP synthase subunit gamma [Epsilonproteobacteria bacterium]|jgi:F-type H+-transporting ATPase subunit gamma|nr:F0F1 ATP synthase subunit gamma [Campylobacterota bacterium]NPA89038.1 F0F1 ATP synthase subunit gamma [Campylobacterota bacterium]